MSILTDLLKGKITFGTAASEAEAWAAKLVTNGATSAGAAQVVSDVKQAASDAVTVGESAIGPLITDAATSIETVLETFLAKATGGVSIVANPLINAGIDTAESTLINIISTWAASTKASLTTPSSSTVLPPLSPTSTTAPILSEQPALKGNG